MNHAREIPIPISWHCVVAAACTAIWFLSLILCTVIFLFLLPKGLRESPLIALVPIVLFLSLTFGATLAASIITSKRAAAGQKELLSRILDGQANDLTI